MRAVANAAAAAATGTAEQAAAVCACVNAYAGVGSHVCTRGAVQVLAGRETTLRAAEAAVAELEKQVRAARLCTRDAC